MSTPVSGSFFILVKLTDFPVA